MFVQLDRLRKGASICLAEPGQLGVVLFTLAPYVQYHCISGAFSFLFFSFFAYLDSCGCRDGMLTMPKSSILALGRVRMSACGGGALMDLTGRCTKSFAQSGSITKMVVQAYALPS